jgi:molybdenum cofactor cytidylyltransferase
VTEPRHNGDDLSRFGVVVLAAGFSSRMGRSKPMLPWGAGTIVQHHLATWSGLGAEQLAVVLRSEDCALGQELDRIAPDGTARIYNDAPEDGMMGSVRLAARWAGWTRGLSHWALVLGDQPHVRLETLAALMKHAGAHPGMICQPSANGARGHPVILPRPGWRRLAESNFSTLRDFLHRHEVLRSFMICDDSGVTDDFDPPESYHAATQPPVESMTR